MDEKHILFVWYDIKNLNKYHKGTVYSFSPTIDQAIIEIAKC